MSVSSGVSKAGSAIAVLQSAAPKVQVLKGASALHVQEYANM